MVCEANISCLSWTLKEREGEWGGGSLVVSAMLVEGGGQAWVTCNGGVLHCGHSTLITPFTITATYCPPPTPHKLPERPVPTISTMTQMKWIIVSLCGISWNTRVRQERRRERREGPDENGCGCVCVGGQDKGLCKFFRLGCDHNACFPSFCTSLYKHVKHAIFLYTNFVVTQLSSKNQRQSSCTPVQNKAVTFNCNPK